MRQKGDVTVSIAFTARLLCSKCFAHMKQCNPHDVTRQVSLFSFFAFSEVKLQSR